MSSERSSSAAQNQPGAVRFRRFLQEEAGFPHSWCCICFSPASRARDSYSWVFGESRRFALCHSSQCEEILANILSIQSLMFDPVVKAPEEGGKDD